MKIGKMTQAKSMKFRKITLHYNITAQLRTFRSFSL